MSLATTVPGWPGNLVLPSAMTDAVLRIDAARPAPGTSPLRGTISLRVEPGELVVVAAEDPAQARALALLCAGLAKLAAGRVCFLGEDWATLPRARAEALRGSIGLAPGDGGWLPHLTVAESMLLARRHHDPTPDVVLRQQADALARHFGLDGLPNVRPAELPRAALARAACARAFLGNPALLILESPLDRETGDAMADDVLGTLEYARARGAAAIWSTRSRRAWEEEGYPATQWFTLEEGQLCPAPP